jgi:type I restriction enzyme S subunit
MKTPAVQLGDLLEIKKGKKAERLLDRPTSSSRRYLQIDDLRPGSKPKFAESFMCPMASPADVIIAWDGANAGTVSYNLNGYIGSTLVALRPNPDKLFAPYLSRFLEGKFDYLQGNSTGATIPHLSRDILESLRIPLPNLSKQQLIACRLDEADRLRRTRRYALELSNTFLPAAFLELLGDPITNPKRFCVAALGDFLSFVTSGSRGWAEYYASEGDRFVRSLDVRMNSISEETAVFVSPPQSAETKRTRVKAGDVLLTITGSRIGRVAPVPESLDGAFVSQHVAILRLKPGLLPVFLSMFLSLGAGGQRDIARLQYGQTKPGLNFDQIREFRIIVPPLSVQEQFAAILAQAERLRATQRESLRQAEHLFQTLLHHAFANET